MNSSGASSSKALSTISHSGDEGSESSENNYELGLEQKDDDELLVVQPLSAEAISVFEAKQARAGIVYISRIPPAMRPSKVRHLMSVYGEIGRIYLQQEDPKRAHLRKKHTSTKKTHYTEGWVEFQDKHVGRTVAGILNGQPIGGKKGTRWRDDVWTMKYLPRFKWNNLTEHVSQEAAAHTARLRVQLSQSRTEQKDYLRNVELARVLGKRAERKRKLQESGKLPMSEGKQLEEGVSSVKVEKRKTDEIQPGKNSKKPRTAVNTRPAIEDVLSSMF